MTTGHASHIQSAHDAHPLPGKMERPIKIVLLGAGSMFIPRFTNDLLHIPGAHGQLALVDIDPQRLATMQQLLDKLIAQMNLCDRWTTTVTTDYRTALPGSDYLINCIEVSGLACVRHDNDIPAKYGIDQCIGDTVGPGGLFKALRTAPVFLDILHAAEELCPDALVLNYTNPMSILCLAASRASSMQLLGLCHSVQGTAQTLARRAGIPPAELEFQCAGINHLAWFTQLTHHGRDLYPILKEKARQDLAGHPSDPHDSGDRIRKEMMLYFGAFITESSGHLSEYLPYYRKLKDIRDAYCRAAYDGESSYYANNWPTWRAIADKDRQKMVSGEKPIGWDRSWEYATWIIEAREKNHPHQVHATVPNRFVNPKSEARNSKQIQNRKSKNQNKSKSAFRNPKSEILLIPNLPANGVVEVECTITRNAITPTIFGYLPPQMAALCDWNMRMIDLAATAAIEKSKEAALHALLLDPLTAAVCSPAQIKQMANELFEAEKDFLPGYK